MGNGLWHDLCVTRDPVKVYTVEEYELAKSHLKTLEAMVSHDDTMQGECAAAWKRMPQNREGFVSIKSMCTEVSSFMREMQIGPNAYHEVRVVADEISSRHPGYVSWSIFLHFYRSSCELMYVDVQERYTKIAAHFEKHANRGNQDRREMKRPPESRPKENTSKEYVRHQQLRQILLDPPYYVPTHEMPYHVNDMESLKSSLDVLRQALLDPPYCIPEYEMPHHLIDLQALKGSMDAKMQQSYGQGHLEGHHVPRKTQEGVIGPGHYIPRKSPEVVSGPSFTGMNSANIVNNQHYFQPNCQNAKSIDGYRNDLHPEEFHPMPRNRGVSDSAFQLGNSFNAHTKESQHKYPVSGPPMLRAGTSFYPHDHIANGAMPYHADNNKQWSRNLGHQMGTNPVGNRRDESVRSESLRDNQSDTAPSFAPGNMSDIAPSFAPGNMSDIAPSFAPGNMSDIAPSFHDGEGGLNDSHYNLSAHSHSGPLQPIALPAVSDSNTMLRCMCTDGVPCHVVNQSYTFEEKLLKINHSKTQVILHGLDKVKPVNFKIGDLHHVEAGDRSQILQEMVDNAENMAAFSFKGNTSSGSLCVMFNDRKTLNLVTQVLLELSDCRMKTMNSVQDVKSCASSLASC